MTINRDFFDNPIVPDYVLCKANKERIGVLKCIEKTSDFKWCDLDEISFTINLYIENEKNQYYEDIDVMKYILLPDIGFYCITDVSISSENTEYESKTIVSKSCECLLAQKYLENFVINMGTVESIDGVSLYNIADKEHSLLHLVLEKCPDWKIGHIDPGLMSMQRSFEISRQDVYSFIMNDIATAFGCFFLFDTINGIINIYKEEVISCDTNIHISYNNLLKNTKIDCSTDDIKTCLTLTGSDDLTVREINMGYDRIYNFSYYNSLEFMSKGLYDAYNKWVKLRESKLDQYTTLLSQYQDYYTQINYVTYEKMPSSPGSTNWTEYGLYPLKEQLSAYEQQQAVLMKAGYGNEDSPFYNTNYLPVYNAIQAINNQLSAVNKQIFDLQSSQSKISNQISEIINLVSMKNNFTEDQLVELSRFVREDELNSVNYIVTDVMTDDEKFEMLHDLLSYGEKELAKVAIPQLSFSAEILNLFAIPEFDAFQGEFIPGNYIWVTLRDDFSVKAKLLTMHINWYDPAAFTVSFGNIARKSKSIYTDITEAIKVATSAATSVSFNQSYWSAAAKNTDSIGQMLEDGLLSAGKYLSSGDDSEMLMDRRGLFVNTTSGPYAYKDSIFMGGGRILFTEDNWKTVSMAVGRADVNGESKFGVFADFLIAGYVAGSTIVASDFNNGNGTFHVDSDGRLTATSADIKGIVKADTGYIGGDKGFTIQSGKLYSGKATLETNASGVYIGTDGISLGAGNTFLVKNDGSLKATNVDVQGIITATSGSIGGASITNNSIHASNGNWYINSDGSASFKNVYITGVNSGSKFGDLSYDNGITSGKFNGDSSYGSNKDNPFSGTAVTHIQELAIGQITAENIKATNVFADYLTASQISSIYATIGSLSAVSARVGMIESDYITAGILNAINVELTGKITAVDGKFEHLDAGKITAGTLSVSRLDIDGILSALNSKSIQCVTFTAQTIRGSSYQYFNGNGGVYTNLYLRTVTIGETTITYLGT